MHNRWKKTLAAAASLALLLGVALAIGSLRQNRRQQSSASLAATSPQAPEENGSPVPLPTVTNEVAAATPKPVLFIPPLPPNAVSVPDDDLLQLSAMVDLANAADRPPDKEKWQQALVIADKLQQGPCDCEQRNWLHHFIETGNSALTAPADYAENVQLMLKLARNDKQAMIISHKTN